MKVLIRRVPPSRVLEGIDFGQLQLKQGHIYELEPRIAKVLVLWDYAERVDAGDGRKPGDS